MANSRGPTSVRHMYYGKNSLLPPKSPFPSIPSSYADYIPSSVIGQKITNFREGNPQHQRTSSESFLMEEQPSWLDDLLNEPDTPVRKGGHRRSCSDSFSNVDSMNVVNMDSVAKGDSISTMAYPSWNLPKYDLYKDVRSDSDPKSSLQERIRAWDPYLSSAENPRGIPSLREKIMHQSSKSSPKSLEAEVVPPTASEKHEALDAGSREPKGSSERKDPSESMPSASETDTKRTKQQFAQRSRVRKLQYIAELERNVQALQAESSGISAELEFLGQRNLILSMENKALKQRLESLAQEHLIKYLEHEVLERERGRLRALYQQQQQPQLQPEPKIGGPRRTSSRDLDQQLAKLSLKHKDANHGEDPLSDQLHI